MYCFNALRSDYALFLDSKLNKESNDVTKIFISLTGNRADCKRAPIFTKAPLKDGERGAKIDTPSVFVWFNNSYSFCGATKTLKNSRKNTSFISFFFFLQQFLKKLFKFFKTVH